MQPLISLPPQPLPTQISFI